MLVSRAQCTAKRCAAEPGPMLNTGSGLSGMAEGFFVYILANRPRGTLYVGVTSDLVRRVSEHRAKLVPGFTRKYGVDQLMYFEEYSSILEARAREYSLKRWRRAWKIELIKKLNPDWHDLSRADALVVSPASSHCRMDPGSAAHRCALRRVRGTPQSFLNVRET